MKPINDGEERTGLTQDVKCTPYVTWPSTMFSITWREVHLLHTSRCMKNIKTSLNWAKPLVVLDLIFLFLTFRMRALVQSEKMGVKVIFQSWNSTNLPRMAGPCTVSVHIWVTFASLCSTFVSIPTELSQNSCFVSETVRNAECEAVVRSRKDKICMKKRSIQVTLFLPWWLLVLLYSKWKDERAKSKHFFLETSRGKSQFLSEWMTEVKCDWRMKKRL